MEIYEIIGPNGEIDYDSLADSQKEHLDEAANNELERLQYLPFVEEEEAYARLKDYNDWR